MKALTRARAGNGGLLFGVVIGLVVGVLATLLVTARETTVVVREGAVATVDGTAGGEDPTIDVSGASPDQPGQPGGTATGSASSGGVAARRPTAGQPARAAGGGPAAAGGASAEPRAEDPKKSTDARGVSAERVKIGVATIDLGPIEHLGYHTGDQRRHWESIRAAWRREGRLPVHGRDVEFVYRSFNPLDPTAARAACVGFVQDDKAFAVVGLAAFQAGADCLAREFKTPVLEGSYDYESAYKRGHPFYFSTRPARERQLRNLPHWAHHLGVFKGKKLGVFHDDDAAERTAIDAALKPELARLGYSLEVQAASDGTGQADLLAVRQFQTAGVDVAIMLSQSQGGFLRAAEAQNYRPRYVQTGGVDAIGANYPPDQYDGALSMTHQHDGARSAGLPLTAEQRACYENFTKHTNEKLTPGTLEYDFLGAACDLGILLLAGLENAGAALRPESYVAGLEQLRNVPLVYSGNVSYTPQKHHGVDQYRTLRWHGSCRCWHAVGEFGPLWVP